ncbi:MAG: cytochrome d ubiquinol oxidase subunit II [Pseudomonadota bacterium]
MDALSAALAPSPTLAVLWFLLAGFFLIIYVVLDGFDLGIGILSLFTDSERRQTLLMASLGTVWDANESWLVVVGGILFGAFPLAYGLILHALYIPIFLLLFGLALRGVALVFHEHSDRHRLWALLFGIGSVLAAVAQGFVLGGLLEAPSIRQGDYVGEAFDWLTPFSLVVAVGVTGGFALLGATYLILKTEGGMQAPYFRLARRLAWVPFAAAAVVTVYSPLRHRWIFEEWFSLPNFYFYAILPLLALFAFYRLFRSLRRGHERAPFLWTVLIFLSSFLGLAATLYPYLIPGRVTIFEAAAPANTLWFMTAVVGFFIPILIAYNAYLYRTFRGKIRPESGYGGERD